jgi:hypothetical protein
MSLTVQGFVVQVPYRRRRPLLALAAYRVAAAPEGDCYFLGRVPLSRFARRANWLVALLVVAAVAECLIVGRAGQAIQKIRDR